MTPSVLRERSYSLPGNSRGIVIYAASALAVTAAAVLLAGRVHPLLLGAGLAAYLAAVGATTVYVSRRPRRARTNWRNVMPCYLSVQDRDLKIIETNELFRQDFGERIGEHCYSVYKESGEPCPNCPVLKTFEDGQIHTGEETVLTRDGKKAEVMVTSAPRYDSRGRIIGVVEMSTNITQIKALQRELELSRAEYQRLFDLVPCYIIVMNRELEVVASNERVRRDFDCNKALHCYEVFKDRHRVCGNCIVEKSFDDGKVHASEESVTTVDGRRVNLICYSMPIGDEDGEISSVMEVATDITEVKTLQHQLTLIGRAVAGLAHRIKNILMGLEGGLFVVNTALETDDKETVSQGWEMVERNVEKVSHIVKDLLYCSKERVPKFQAEVSPGAIAREVVELFRERTAREGIDLMLEADEAHTNTLDPDSIHSLLTNLVTNAIDACRFDPDETKERHTINVRSGDGDGGATLIEIEDNGAGIPDEVSSRVFEDFFSTKGTEGTGLGLLVIRRVVEEHGGDITYTSAPGRGTVFRVVIPRRE